MQPHLPHKLAAWVLAASVFGAMASQSQAAGESISINFGSNEGTIPDSSTAGLSSVTGSNWNQFSDASQSTRQALKDNNGAATGADVTWSSKNIWQTSAAPTTGDGQLLKGYLDDGNGINITVSGLDFLTYGVYIYCNTDNGTDFSAKTVNGISYTWNGSSTVTGSSGWGATGTTDQLIEGTNVLYVDGQTASSLTIGSTGNSSGTGTRGCISGIQIVNTYDGAKIAATLDGGTSAWTDSLLGTAAWTDSTASDGTYASIDVTNGPSTLTIAGGETRSTDALVVSGGNLTISGGSLNLTGPGILRVAEGTTLTLSTSLTGNAALDGAGTVIMNGTNSLTSLSGGGNLMLGDNASLSITGDAVSRYTGSLTLGENATITASNPNWTFGGALTMAAANYNANDSWAHNASSLTLTGAGDVEYTFEGGTLIPITHADSTLTVRKTTDSTGSIGANHVSDIAHLMIDAGTVNLTEENTSYTFQTITIGQNAKLSLAAYGTVFENTPSILMKSGSMFEMLNSKSWNNTLVNANITVDAADSGITVAGSLYGDGTELGGTITGEGEILFTHSSSGTNGYTVSSVISDKDADHKLSVRVNKTGSGHPVRQQYIQRRHHHHRRHGPDQLRHGAGPGLRYHQWRHAERQQPVSGKRHHPSAGRRAELRQCIRSEGHLRQPDGERNHQQLHGCPEQRGQCSHDHHRAGPDDDGSHDGHAEQRFPESHQLQYGAGRPAGHVIPHPDRRPDAQPGQRPGFRFPLPDH